MTVIEDAGGSKFQQRLRPGLCAVSPDKAFQYGEMAWLLPRGDLASRRGSPRQRGGEDDRIAARWLR